MKYCSACSARYPNSFDVCPRDYSPLRQSSDIEPGTIIRGKYVILEKLGAGGMATVYRAHHKAFDEVRAIKVVNPDLAENEEFLKRFRHEAKLTRKLRHPNAVAVQDFCRPHCLRSQNQEVKRERTKVNYSPPQRTPR